MTKTMIYAVTIVINQLSIVDYYYVFRDGDDVTVFRAEELFDFGAVFAGKSFKLGAANAGNGFGVFVVPGTPYGEHYDITSLECTLDGNYPTRQQALAGPDRSHRTIVDQDCPGGTAVENPSRTIREFSFRHEDSTDFFAGDDPADDVFQPTVRKDDSTACVGGYFRRLDFRFHAARTVPAALAARVANYIIGYLKNGGYWPGVGGFLRILIVKSVDVAEHNQKVGVYFAGDQSAEFVIIAKRRTDFVRADAVVLVEDRHHTQLQQRLDRMAKVQVRFSVIKHSGCQQDLGDGNAVTHKRFAVLGHQQRLADSSARLTHLYILRPVGLQLAEPHPDGAGTDNNYLFAGLEQRVHLPGHTTNVSGIDCVILSQNIRADLYYYSFCLAKVSHCLVVSI